MKPQRASNIELLRIITMCGVVILHYNNESIGGALGYVAQNSVNHWLLLVLEGLFVCAVNLFILITGYFSCVSQRRNPLKVIGLLLQVIVFRLGVYFLGILQGDAFALGDLLQTLLPANYFVILYIGVYLLSPYLNIFLQKLTKKQLEKLLMLSLVLLSVWPTVVDFLEESSGRAFLGLNTIGMYGSDYGYTLIHFLFMYLVGAYLRLADVSVKKRYSGSIVLLCAIVCGVGGKWFPGTAWSYCNPLVILEATAAFLLFRKLQFSSRIVNTLSKACFTCFLFHNLLLGKLQIQLAVQQSSGYMLLHILTSAVALFLISWVVYLVYDFFAGFLLRPLQKQLNKNIVDSSVEGS